MLFSAFDGNGAGQRLARWINEPMLQAFCFYNGLPGQTSPNSAGPCVTR
jgi:hypothetical protein